VRSPRTFQQFCLDAGEGGEKVIWRGDEQGLPPAPDLLISTETTLAPVTDAGDDRAGAPRAGPQGAISSSWTPARSKALDTAFRLLDASSVKQALRTAQAPLALVVSAGLFESGLSESVRSERTGQVFSVQIAGSWHQGLIQTLGRTG
jgi:hypothetical protein